jgi:hypothetical protein
MIDYTRLAQPWINAPYPAFSLINDPNILKVGQNNGSDLKHLQQAAHINTPFGHFLDIAQLAKSRRVTKTATTSLAELVAIVLRCCMDKDEDIHISTEWDAKNFDKHHRTVVYALFIWLLLLG